MNRSVLTALGGALLLVGTLATPASASDGSGGVAHGGRPAAAPSPRASAKAAATKDRSACLPSRLTVHAEPAPVPGLSAEQVHNAVAIINAAARAHVPQRGQTIAVMTALETSGLRSTARPVTVAAPSGRGLFGRDLRHPADALTAALSFYRSLLRVNGWQNLTPTLAAHAAQRNLDPQVYAKSWPQAVSIVDKLTTGSGVAGLRNLAARAQQVARCQAATLRGRFALNGSTAYVGQFTPAALDARALDFVRQNNHGWFDRCQSFVAQLAGRPFSGYRTALDAWQTFEAEGVAHPVTGVDGVSPPVGAWLYYTSSNPAGHVVTYLGNGQIASTDVFGHDQVGIGPASAVTNGPWHLQYLGWAAPWGHE